MQGRIQIEDSIRYQLNPKRLSDLISKKYSLQQQIKSTTSKKKSTFNTSEAQTPGRRKRKNKPSDRSSKRKEKTNKRVYVQNILKNQKIKMFTQLFIKKIKQSYIGKNSFGIKQQQLLVDAEKQNAHSFLGIQLSKIQKILFNILTIIHIAFLSIYATISLIFNKISNSEFITTMLIFSIFVNGIQIIFSFIVQKNFEGKKISRIRDLSKHYLKRKFIIDIIIFIILWVDLFSDDVWIAWLRLFFLTKIDTLMDSVQELQISLISNFYREQYWALAKVFIFNFLFAHILAIFLIAMSRLQDEDNWIYKKDLNNNQWYQQYIWSYYWGTTIMLTVGFGDISPTNTGQALCMIFIETFSCLVLAYNVNCVGNIISCIRSYDIQKSRDLKIFNQISQQSKLQEGTSDQITDYIRESVKIKRNYNIDQEKDFIDRLPGSFRNDLLEQKNRDVLNNIIFFKNLSEKMINYIAVKIQKKLAHPSQIIYMKGQLNDIVVLNKGHYSYCYNKGNSILNGTPIHKFTVGKNQFNLLSLGLFFGQQINYDVKCIDYTILYKISYDQLIKILQKNLFDYQYFMMIKEKDKYLTNQYQVHKCQYCQKEKHTMFKCPKFHYVPLKWHVIDKNNLLAQNQKCFRYQDYYRDVVNFGTLFNSKVLKQKLQYRQADIIRTTRSLLFMTKEEDTIIQDSNIHQSNSQKICQKMLVNPLPDKTQISTVKINKQLNNFRKRSMQFFEQQAQKMRDDLSRLVGTGRCDIWDLGQLDTAYDFKFYFTSGNPSNISSKQSLAFLRKMNSINNNGTIISNGEKTHCKSPLKRIKSLI